MGGFLNGAKPVLNKPRWVDASFAKFEQVHIVKVAAIRIT